MTRRQQDFLFLLDGKKLFLTESSAAMLCLPSSAGYRKPINRLKGRYSISITNAITGLDSCVWLSSKCSLAFQG